MPTFDEAKTALWRYARREGVIAQDTSDAIVAERINQACERLITDGNWRGTISFYTGTVSTFTHNGEDVAGIELPAYLVTALAVANNVGAVGINNRWFETKAVGASLLSGGLRLTDIGDSDAGLRRYLTPAHEAGDSITIQAKRRFVTLTNADDDVFPPNLGAIKLGMIALNYEDESDLKTAEENWGKARQILSTDTRDYIGETSMGGLRVSDVSMTTQPLACV